jgi:hypothetical protein
MSQLKGVFSHRLCLFVLAVLALSMLAVRQWSGGEPRAGKPLGVGQGVVLVGDFGARVSAHRPPTIPAPIATGEQAALEHSVVLTSAYVTRTNPPSESAAYKLLSSLEEPDVARYTAPATTLVADNIDLDPSITETPALPQATTTEAQRLEGSALHGPLGPSEEVPPSAESGVPATNISLQEPEPGPITEPAPVLPEPEPTPEIPATKAWPFAAGLIEQMNIVAATVPEGAAWAARVNVELEGLARQVEFATPAAAQHLSRLDALADEAKSIAAQVPGLDARSRLLRSGYAIVRRIVVWQQVYAIAAAQGDVAPVIDSQAWDHALAAIDGHLSTTGAALAWRKYLLIDDARRRFDPSVCSPGEQRQLARDILHRLHSTQLSRDQEQFLRSGPIETFEKQLRLRAAETPDLVALLAAIEHFEHEGYAAEAHGLAGEYDRIRWSEDTAVLDLAETVNAYYRNANLRVAISSALVNRMLPRSQQMYEPVKDTILGAQVQGDSHTSTQLRLVLVPDSHRWNIGLEAVGEIASNTSSSKGPATFHQDGVSFFRARKRVTVDRRGIRLQNAEAAANANNNLDTFETDFDGIPLFGSLVRAIARNQYETSQPAAKVEVEGKIVWRATSQLDREVTEKIEKSKQDFQTKIVDPLRDLELEPTAVDMETTAERLIGRYRIAGRKQVSAHTPRPQAPGDSLLSVQIHQTALNNVLEQLGLAGRRVELRELYKEMTDRFSQEKVEIPDDLPENVFVTFADEDPVRIDCQDGRVRLQIRLKELSQEGTRNRWTNFTVRGYYAPVADQLDANLEREGVIELIGDRLRIGDRIALSGIFGKVLSRNRKLNLVNKQLALAPELKDLQVTQFVIHDGWIGVALGPQTPGRTAAMSPRPELGTRHE